MVVMYWSDCQFGTGNGFGTGFGVSESFIGRSVYLTGDWQVVDMFDSLFMLLLKFVWQISYPPVNEASRDNYFMPKSHKSDVFEIIGVKVCHRQTDRQIL